ncbi:hypothetical protein CJ030_MR7G017758 [Morella rubra]|uniref:EF-hand domain-containing protein n=1 Tax=Morella rubra TaxID=262757 RepID=A0A6A1UZS1_9ROSI|nr:hypothetical protein CJ030_MR7G017758 [Morella rubra]
MVSEEEGVKEASLGHTSSKCWAGSGFEDIPHVLSPIFGVHTEIPVPIMKKNCEIGNPSFNAALVAPSISEMMEDAQQVPRQVKSEIGKLEGELESQRKLVEELQAVARGAYSQVQTARRFRVEPVSEESEAFAAFEYFCASSSKREEELQAEAVELRLAMCEPADSFIAEKKGLEESRTGLTVRVAALSAVPAFPDDPVVLACRCIGVAMAILDIAYMRERSHFQVRKERCVMEIYEKLETFGTCGIHLPLAEDETFLQHHDEGYAIFNVVWDDPKSVGPVTYTRDDLVGVFNRDDKNKDGKLSKSELKEAFGQIGSRWPQMRASPELLHADENHNGLIDREEFEKFIDYVLKHNYRYDGLIF